MKLLIALVCLVAPSGAISQVIDTASYASIVEALQHQFQKHPSVFPLESYTGGTQSVTSGLRYTYFGYGERQYPERFDFHPANDVAYFPLETGNVTTEDGKSTLVRAPQTYLKKVYAIQKGKLVSIALQQSGYKIILEHKLEKPYYDNQGRSYSYYYTCYRHLDSRTLSHLNAIARKDANDLRATYESLFGKFTFDAGQQIAFVGFNPNVTTEIPRSHLDFSLNLFGDPNEGENIRKYALNPLLLFPPMAFEDPHSYEIGRDGMPAYKIVIDASTVVAPTKENDGHFSIEIHSGGWSEDDVYSAVRYFALNAMDVVLYSDQKHLGSHRVDRHRRLGYNTESFDLLDSPDKSAPHFLAPLGEQQDAFKMTVVLPSIWLEEKGYDWAADGLISIGISSIWKGYLSGHSQSLTISLTAEDPE